MIKKKSYTPLRTRVYKKVEEKKKKRKERTALLQFFRKKQRSHNFRYSYDDQREWGDDGETDSEDDRLVRYNDSSQDPTGENDDDGHSNFLGLKTWIAIFSLF